MLNSPISVEKLHRIIELFELTQASRVFELGCGEGDFIRRVFDRWGANCHGLDPDVEALACCRKQEDSAKLILHASTGADFTWPAEPFDVAACIGSSHALEGFVPTIKTLRDHVRPGGLILMGDIYWRKRPEPAYEAFLGEGWPSFDIDHHAYVLAGENAGLISLYSVRSNADEWDHFEGLFTMRNLRQAQAISDETLRAKTIQKRKAWRDAYLKWGHATLGFGLYLFQKPLPE